MGAEAREHSFEATAIFVGHGDKTQAKTASAFNVTNDSVGFDAAFLDEEVELGFHAFLELEVGRLNEEAIDADVEDAGDIVAAVALPADPDVLGCRKARKGTA
jgi:hypothetical protein